MKPGEIFIHVFECRAAVARYELAEKGIAGTITFRLADNWEELEPEAIASIRKCGGTIKLSGSYPCPQPLAEKADLPDSYLNVAVTLLDGSAVNGMLTTEHAAGSYGQPVVVAGGQAYGPGEVLWIDGGPEVREKAAAAGYPVVSQADSLFKK